LAFPLAASKGEIYLLHEENVKATATRIKMSFAFITVNFRVLDRVSLNKDNQIFRVYQHKEKSMPIQKRLQSSVKKAQFYSGISTSTRETHRYMKKIMQL